MGIRDVLVYVDNDAEAARRCAFAVSLASAHGAHLSGLYARRPLYDPRYIGTYIPADVVAVLQSEADEQEQRACAAFGDSHQGSGLAVRWRVVEGAPGALLTAEGRNTDLVILGQRNPADPGQHRHYSPEEVLLGAGRPVLLLPALAPARYPFRHALIAWNAGREAARAVRDALPLLAACERVSVVSVAGPDGGETEGVIRYLERHDLEAVAHRLDGDQVETGPALLALAKEQNADLVVAGAYGHSRLREFVLGGTTAYLMRHSQVPLSLSH